MGHDYGALADSEAAGDKRQRVALDLAPELFQATLVNGQRTWKFRLLLGALLGSLAVTACALAVTGTTR